MLRFFRSLCLPQVAMILLVVILGVSSMLSGCGKKGPLFIPKSPDNQQKQ